MHNARVMLAPELFNQHSANVKVGKHRLAILDDAGYEVRMAGPGESAGAKGVFMCATLHSIALVSDV
jgi:hypothetical protein